MDERLIRFVDFKRRELFTLPDGANIILEDFNGKRSKLPCKYIDEHHAEIDGHEYFLGKFAFMQEHEGAVFSPEWMRPEDACGVYEIYQIKDIGNTDYAFRSFEEAGKNFDPLNYRRVYASMLAPGLTLEELYAWHNNDNRPFGKKIHSMSMSDIVILSRGGLSTAHYVDTFGFTAVPQFLEPQTVTDDRKQVVSGYTVTVRMPVGNKVFVLAENPNAVQPFVTWQGHKAYKGYEWGHYHERRTDAVKDLYKRVTDERDNSAFSPNKPKNRDEAR